MKSYTYRALLAALLVVQVKALASGGNSPRVLTQQGYVRGIRENVRCSKGCPKVIYKFLGIPFAQTPNGTLRFKPPQPLTMNRSSEYDATYYRPICAQSDVNDGKIREAWRAFNKITDVSEDCLHLNIYTPFINGSTKYPVMVFIHEGIFRAGTPIFGDAPGKYLPTRDVVLVTIQYRLGPFGFFTTGDSEAPGNVGLLDQVEALKWVQQNIEGFGGDKNSVTLLGESAGGTSVGLHYLSPLSIGLFHRGIAVSGVDLELSPYVLKLKSVVVDASKGLIERNNCSVSGGNAAKIRCLQSRAWKDILHLPFINSMSPVVDNRFLLANPWKLRKNGSFRILPFMAGYTSQDGSHIVESLLLTRSRWMVNSVKEFKKYIKKALSLIKVDNVTQQDLIYQLIEHTYLPTRSVPYSGSQYLKALVDVCTDFSVAAPTHAALTYHSRHGAPAYMFEFAHRRRQARFPYDRWMGASHGDTKEYEFGKPFLKPPRYNNRERDVSDIMVTMFTNFAKFGNPTPNPVHGVQWQTFTSTNKAYLRIKSIPAMARRYHTSRIKAWNTCIKKMLKPKTRPFQCRLSRDVIN